MLSFFRALRHPITSVILLLLLAAGLWRVPTTPTGSLSTTPWTLPHARSPHTLAPMELTVFLIGEGESLKIEDLDSSSAQGLVVAVQEDPKRVIRAHLQVQSHAAGLLDITRVRTRASLDVRPLVEREMSPEEKEIVRARVAAWVGSEDGPRLRRAAAALRAGGVFDEWRAAGILNSLLIAAAGTLFAWSLTGWPGALRRRRERRRARALARGRCPSCGYAVELAWMTSCPECGNALSETPRS